MWERGRLFTLITNNIFFMLCIISLLKHKHSVEGCMLFSFGFLDYYSETLITWEGAKRDFKQSMQNTACTLIYTRIKHFN